MKNNIWEFESNKVRNGVGEGQGPKGPSQESSKSILRAVRSHSQFLSNDMVTLAFPVQFRKGELRGAGVAI